MNKVTLSATSSGCLVLLSTECSCYEDSLKILKGLGFTHKEAEEFINNEDDIEVGIVPLNKIKCAEEYNSLASIV